MFSRKIIRNISLITMILLCALILVFFPAFMSAQEQIVASGESSESASHGEEDWLHGLFVQNHVLALSLHEHCFNYTYLNPDLKIFKRPPKASA